MKKFVLIFAVFLIGFSAFAAKPTIHYFDVTYASYIAQGQRIDHYQAAFCLQGLVNREAPRLFIKFWPFGENGGDYNWLVRLRESGGLCEGWPVQTISGDVKNLITEFEDYINGVILFDSDETGVISTNMVATTAAGCEDAIAVRKDTSAGSLYNWLVNDASGPQLPVLIDLTGKFTGSGTIWGTSTPSTGSAKCDAYIWAKEKYLDTGKCDPTVILYGRDLWYLRNNIDHSMLQCNLDYAVMKRGFCLELSPWTDESASDDPGQPTGTDGNTLRAILNSANIQTNKQKMIKTIGFVAWDQKYTNWAGGNHGGVDTEWELAKVFTAYNAYKEATWQISNSSFHSGLLPLINQRNYVQNPAPSYQDLVNRGIINSSNGAIYDGHYILIGLGDYDGATWTYYEIANGSNTFSPGLWSDNNRGQVYCGWAINPNLMDTIGPAFDYFYRTKTSKDFFMAWDSGAGYVNPGQLWDGRLSGYPSAVDIWQKHCIEDYRRLDYSISGWLLDGYRDTKTTDCEYYAPFSGDGIGLDNPGFSNPRLINGVPVIGKKEPYEPDAGDIDDDWSGGVDFDFYRHVLMSPTELKNLESAYAGYGRNFRFLDPFSFYYLLRYKLSGYDQSSNWYRETWVDDSIPRIMQAGQTYSVSVTVRNDGWDTWSEAGLYRLGDGFVASGAAANNSNRKYISGGASIASGQQVTFSYNLTAPLTPGNYDYCYDMVRDGVTWFEWKNNIIMRKPVIVAANETDIDTDGDGVPDVTEDAQGTYWWHPDDGDMTAPTGSIVINSGSAYATSTSVTLSLSATDDSGTVSQMRFSNNNSSWSTWQTYGTSKSWTLTSGTGTKYVYVQFKDVFENISASYSDSIYLDTSAPTGGITIEYGNPVTFYSAVNLTLNASDIGSGISQMNIYNNGWLDWEPYSSVKQITLPIASHGSKTVYVRYKDNAGNTSSLYSDTIQYSIKGDFTATWQDVDISDLAYFAAKWLDICGQDHCQAADINLDGDVGLKDFAEMARNW